MNKYRALLIILVIGGVMGLVTIKPHSQESSNPQQPGLRPRRESLARQAEKELLNKLNTVLNNQRIKIDENILSRQARSESYHTFELDWEAYLNAPKTVQVNDARYQQSNKISIASKINAIGPLPPPRQALDFPFRGFLVVGINNDEELVWWTQISDPRLEYTDTVSASGELSGGPIHHSSAKIFLDIPDGLDLMELRFFNCSKSDDSWTLNLFARVPYGPTEKERVR